MDRKLIEAKMIAAALARRERLLTSKAFDPLYPESIPTKKQQQVFDEFGIIKKQWIVAGNQCLAEDTLIMTPQGPVKIQDIKVGDTVYSEHGLPIKVLNTFDNGRKEVADITFRGKIWASATAEHRFLVQDSHKIFRERALVDAVKDDLIIRKTVKAPLGSKRELHAYAIGALLGDGCSRQSGTQIQLSSVDSLVPTKIASILNAKVNRQNPNNYTWKLETSECNHYNKWCKGRYAHEKIVDIEEIKKWDRQSLTEFVAGLIDTDGSVHPGKDFISFSLSMQSKSVLQAFEYAVLALWQVPLSKHIDNRTKYKNGPVYEYYTRNARFIREILRELDPHIVSPQKKWREEYETLGGRRTSEVGIGLKWGRNPRIVNTYDIHVDSPTNLYLLANGLVTHNSGKSQTAARLVTWVLTETHPTWKRPEEWKDESLFILVLGQNGKQIEESLLPKLTSYLEEGSYKEVRIGNIIQKLEYKNGNRIVFQSLENPIVARKRIQSYVTHLVWQDEMPPDLNIIDESFRRLQARDGYYLASFTPLVINKEIQDLVDSSDGVSAAKYQFNMLDNPLYADPKRKAQLLAELSQFPEAVQRTRLYGDWSSPDNAVYQFNRQSMVEDPPNYSRGWRHVESSDPATESKFGFTLWAEDPNTGIWYLVRADYVSNIYVPERIYDHIMSITSGYNIVRRIADPAATWYINTARSHNVQYSVPYSKNNRKAELIKNLQQALGVGHVKIASWCTDFIREIEECQWSDSVNQRIINASKYHLLDSAQYFVDLKPRGEVIKQEVPWYTQAKLDLQKHVQKKAEEKKRIQMKLQRRRRRGWSSFTL